MKHSMRMACVAVVLLALAATAADQPGKLQPPPKSTATAPKAVTEKSSQPQPQPKSTVAVPKTAAPQSTRTEDEKAIRLNVEAFAKCYNAGDAKALAALFAPDAEIVDEEGEAFQGQESIEKVFAAVFKEHPKGRIEIDVDSIRFVSPGVAVEDGVTTTTHEPDGPADKSRYTVVHVKQDGKWRMVSARDLSDEPSTGDEELKQLAWLIGDWVDESPDALIVTSYRWTDNHNFILSEFKIQVGGRPAMTGSQRIGWDPLTKQIRSWVFDSEGGFGEGLWTCDDDQWIIKMRAVTRDGKMGSATNVITMISKDRITWESRDRVVGGERMPDVDAVPVVRKPPKPTM
jgi:uncharacterized protein (TIGR02246 family)